MARELWMFPRPHRRLLLVPQSLAAFASVAEGRNWKGNRDAQIRFEDALDRSQLKRGGDYQERTTGTGGSGGRTHASLLQALGLWLQLPAEGDSPAEVRLTLAGQALLDGGSPLEVLRRQVFSHQYPSTYGESVHIAARFKVRPFILLLGVLRHPLIGSRLSAAEMGYCLLPYGEGHKPADVEDAVARVIEFRAHGTESIEPGFAEKFSPKSASAELLRRNLHDIAHTCQLWLRYTGLVQTAEGDASTIVLPEESELEADGVIAEWSAKPLLRMIPTPEGKATFQRQYGLPPGSTKDTRRLRGSSGSSPRDQVVNLIVAAVLAMSTERVVLESSAENVAEIVKRTGISRESVAEHLPVVLGTREKSMGRFLDRYRELAFQGREEAISFEKATAAAVESFLGVSAEHVGQGGRVPDVVLRADDWLGIVDTKAYSAYDLPSDHQLRMQASYIPRYSDGPPAFFTYIAGGFAPSFNSGLTKIMENTQVKGSGLGITAWIRLLSGWRNASATRADLLELFQSGREVTVADVEELLSR